MPLDTERTDRTANRRLERARLLIWVFGVLCGIVLAALMGLSAVWLRSGAGLIYLLRAALGSSTYVNIGQPTVVRQIQQLQRLETVLYTLENVVEGEHDYSSVLP